MKNPPTPKRFIEDLAIAQAEFDSSPKNNHEDASENFKKEFIRREYFAAKAIIKLIESKFYDYISDEDESFWDSKDWTKKGDIGKIFARSKKLIPLLDHIKKIMKYPRTKFLQQFLPEDQQTITMEIEKTKEKVIRELALFSFDDDKYDAVTDVIDCSIATIKKYLAAMEKQKIIKKVCDGRGGGVTRKPTIYAIGYWLEYPNKDGDLQRKFLPFLKGKVSKEMLLEFKLK